MLIKEFDSLEEIQKYYNKKTDTYVFKEDNEYIDLVIFNFDLSIDANIEARDINAWDIDCFNIKACDIKARNIKANNISYHAVCVAYRSIKCKSIKGRREYSKHLVLGGNLEVEEK